MVTSDLPARPAVLGRSVVITNLDDLDAALHELGYINHLEQTLVSRCKAHVAELSAEYAALFVVDIDGVPAKAADRRAELLDLVRAWAKKNLAKHMPEGKKTFDLVHGSLSMRQQPLAVAFEEGHEEKDVLANVEKKVGLAARISTWLGKVKIGSYWLNQIVTLKPALNKNAIKSAYTATPAGRRTLKALGVTVIGGDDELDIKPAQYQVATRAA